MGVPAELSPHPVWIHTLQHFMRPYWDTVLNGSFESSVDGLYIVGPAAANSFGPLMRFMVGAEYVAPLVAGRIARRARRARRLTAA